MGCQQAPLKRCLRACASNATNSTAPALRRRQVCDSLWQQPWRGGGAGGHRGGGGAPQPPAAAGHSAGAGAHRHFGHPHQHWQAGARKDSGSVFCKQDEGAPPVCTEPRARGRGAPAFCGCAAAGSRSCPPPPPPASDPISASLEGESTLMPGPSAGNQLAVHRPLELDERMVALAAAISIDYGGRGWGGGGGSVLTRQGGIAPPRPAPPRPPVARSAPCCRPRSASARVCQRCLRPRPIAAHPARPRPAPLPDFFSRHSYGGGFLGPFMPVPIIPYPGEGCNWARALCRKTLRTSFVLTHAWGWRESR